MVSMIIFVSNKTFTFKELNKVVNIPISDIKDKTYNEALKSITISALVNSHTSKFTFRLSSITLPQFNNYTEMKSWFDKNIIIQEPKQISDISELTDNQNRIPIRISQLNNNSGFIEEAPNDGLIYGRKNKDWVEVTLASNIRRSETFYAPSYISYLGFAPDGSAESDAVWTITKRVGSADGTIISNVQSFNKKWTERGLL